MKSSRLPGKVLELVGDRPLLWHVVTRAQRSQTLDAVIVATSDTAPDDEIEGYCRSIGTECFRGNEHDVLDRYYQAVQHFDIGTIVRLTADCPMLDPEVIDKVHFEFQRGDFDYVSNSIQRTYPDGLDAEVFSRESLTRAWSDARLMSEREHVTPYIWKNPQLFRLGTVLHDQDLSALRWTVDEPEDLEMVRGAHKLLGTLPANLNQTLELFAKHPELNEINRGFEINEGYKKSLREDSLVKLS